MTKKKNYKEWEYALDMMTDEQLIYIYHHPVGYDPAFWEMAYEKCAEGQYAVPVNDAMINAIIEILGQMGCQCEIDEDDEIFFSYKGSEFSIRFDEQLDYIIMADNNWKRISLNDSNKVNNAIPAINRTNIWHGVTTAYLFDDEEQVMEIYSTTNIPFHLDIDYLKKYIPSKLDVLLTAHQLMEYFQQERETASTDEPSSKTN